MTQVDNLILAVIAISSAFGVRRGFIKEIMSLLSWIAALLVSRVYSVSLASILENLIDNLLFDMSSPFLFCLSSSLCKKQSTAF